MDNIIDFVSNNYSWFLTITIILLFALVGYIYDSKKDKKDLLKKAENEIEELSLENIIVPEKSLSETVKKSKNIDLETEYEELDDKKDLNNNKTQDISNSN